MAVRLAHEVWGRGPTRLVALHGFTGSRGSWAHLRPFWEGDCTVLAVDLPGHGETALSAAPDFRLTVEALVELVLGLGFVRSNLLGYSLGARVALGLALRAPELWERVILESGSPGLRRRQARRERRHSDERLAASIEERGVEDFVRRWEELPLFASLRALSQKAQDSLRARRLEAGAEGLAGSLRGLGLGSQPNFWPHLPAMRLPTLLLTGAKDTKFTEVAVRMAAELPTAWRRTFHDVGHVPHLEAPEEYAAEVLTFLHTPWMETPLIERETGSE
jgi:2-succinyl-6-hydroxy-2,4-cyclohexadiene-1-carboxylate synthase